MNKKIVHDALILTAFTLVSVLFHQGKRSVFVKFCIRFKTVRILKHFLICRLRRRRVCRCDRFFRNYGQFQGKQTERFEVVKQAPASDSEIESISGATITSKAVTNGVNASITYFKNVLEGGAE